MHKQIFHEGIAMIGQKLSADEQGSSKRLMKNLAKGTTLFFLVKGILWLTLPLFYALYSME